MTSDALRMGHELRLPLETALAMALGSEQGAVPLSEADPSKLQVRAGLCVAACECCACG
jgi:hypothetical protein